MQIDAGISPSLDEELAAEIEVLVLPRAAQPRRIAGALMDDDSAIVDVESCFGTALHGPAIERTAVKEAGEASFAGGLGRCPHERRGGSAGEKCTSIHPCLPVNSL